MTYLQERRIGGRTYHYLTKSIRLPDGKIKKIQKLVRNPGADPKRYEEYFTEKIRGAQWEYALKRYRLNSVYTKDEFRKIEGIRVDYRTLLAKLTKSQLKDVFDRFTVNYTYESNALEGNSLTLKDVAIVMLENTIPREKNLREVYDTRNSRRVVEQIIKKKLRINHKDVKKMHRILMTDISTAIGYKKIPNYIVGKTIETTPPEKVEEEMTKLLAWTNENPEKLHPLQLSADFHGKFEKIHPLEDGNGRVGRFLSNVILVNNDYPPLIIRKTQRMSYLKALEDFDRGYKPNLERFFLRRFKETYEKFFCTYVKYIR
jgi:Fic family protein